MALSRRLHLGLKVEVCKISLKISICRGFPRGLKFNVVFPLLAIWNFVFIKLCPEKRFYQNFLRKKSKVTEPVIFKGKTEFDS